MPIPLESYVDAWHGQQAVRWIERYDRQEPFFLFVGFPGPHDPWDAPAEAVQRYRGVDISMPSSTRRPTIEGTGRYGALLNAFLWVSDSETMTDDAIRGMRRSYAADISVIDQAVGDMVAALERTGVLDNTWIIYTSDHGEMGGNHGLMSKCVLYEPAVRVPLIVRPPGGWPPRRRGLPGRAPRRAGHGARDRRRTRHRALSEGRSLLASVHDPLSAASSSRSLTVSENWGFAAFETERYKLVVDEDALAPCQLFDLSEDPAEDHDLLPDPTAGPVVEEIMETHVRPFFRTLAGPSDPEHLHRRVRLNDRSPSPSSAPRSLVLRRLGNSGRTRRFGRFAEPTKPDEGVDQDREHAGGDQGGGVLRLHPVLADAQRRDDDDDRQARGGQDGQAAGLHLGEDAPEERPRGQAPREQEDHA